MKELTLSHKRSRNHNQRDEHFDLNRLVSTLTLSAPLQNYGT